MIKEVVLAVGVVVVLTALVAWVFGGNRSDEKNTFANVGKRLNTEPAQRITALTVQRDGKILIGVEVISPKLGRRNVVARLNPNGDLDRTFDSGSGANENIYAIFERSDGKILIGGEFSIYDGIEDVGGVVLIDSNGNLDLEFNRDGEGADDSITTFFEFNEREILVGGYFSTFNDHKRIGVVKIDYAGNVDEGFSTDFTTQAYIDCITLDQDQRVLISGGFNNVSNTEYAGVARLNKNGTIDTRFDIGKGIYQEAAIFMEAIKDRKILIGGRFPTIDGKPRNGLAVLDYSGRVTSDLNNRLGATENSWLSVFALQGDGRILAAGRYIDSPSDKPKGPFVRINPNGSLDKSFSTTLEGLPYFMQLDHSEKILISGNFTAVNGIARDGLARLNQNGDLDQTFDFDQRTIIDLALKLNVLPSRQRGVLMINGREM